MARGFALAWTADGGRRHMAIATRPLPRAQKKWASFAAGPFSFSINIYQTRHALALTIFCPDLQLKACSNSDMFDTTLSMRKTGREWGSVVTARRAISGRTLEHHE